jgi:hypothetical protein
MRSVIGGWAVVVALAAVGLSACGGGGGGGGTPPGGTTPTRFALSVTVAGNGSVVSQPAGIDCGTTCSASFDGGAGVTLTATAAAGHSFQSWGGACSAATGATCSVTMSQARSAVATFAASPATGWSTPAVPRSPAAPAAPRS